MTSPLSSPPITHKPAQNVEAEEDDIDEVDDNDEEEDLEDDDAQNDNSPSKKAFEEILEKVKNNDLQWATVKNDEQKSNEAKANFKQFREKYGHLLNEKIDKNHTILHVMAYLAPSKPSLKSLVQFLVKNHPGLMLVCDEDEKIPLYAAIYAKKWNLVKWMLEKCANLDEVLGKQCRRVENCLHAAIRNRLPSKTMIDLMIKKVRDTTLMAADSKGFTPLHLAVEYDKCTETQYDVIKELIKHGDAALDKSTNPPEGWSPYRYHMHTRGKTERQQQQVKANRANKRDTIEPQTGDGLNQRQPRTTRESGRLEDSQSRRQSSNRRESFAVNVNGLQLRRESSSTNGSAASHTRQQAGFLARESLTTQSPSASRDPSNTRQKPDTTVTEECAGKIREELKLHYLRTRGPQEATEGLYGPNKDGKLIAVGQIF